MGAGEKIDIESLLTGNSFARISGVNTTYIYKLNREGKTWFIDIIGVHFIDKTQYAPLVRQKRGRKSITIVLISKRHDETMVLNGSDKEPYQFYRHYNDK